MRFSVILLVALLLTVLSAGYQRSGPLRQVEGEGFCPGVELCFVAVKGAGLPLPFLIDNPRYSINGSLDLAEDEFRPGIFALDLLFYAVVLGLAVHLLGRGASHQPEPERATASDRPALRT